MDQNVLNELTESIQKECHSWADALERQAPEVFMKLDSQDMTNVFLFRKLAEYELRLQKLESK